MYSKNLEKIKEWIDNFDEVIERGDKHEIKMAAILFAKVFDINMESLLQKLGADSEFFENSATASMELAMNDYGKTYE